MQSNILQTSLKAPRDSKTSEPSKPYHHLAELTGMHKGEMAFVLGNGWSIKYYDVKKLSQFGTLIGCNLAATRYPVDYLVFQDTGVVDKCKDFKGIKFCPYGRCVRKNLDPETTFFIHSARMAIDDPARVELMHSGGMALQIASVLGFKEIILVGCDCCMLEDEELKEMRSNIFEDKHVKRVQARKRGGMLKTVKTEHGVYKTVSQLIRFARKFDSLYEKLTKNNDLEVYRLGRWGILNIPIIEYKPFWSKAHPDIR